MKQHWIAFKLYAKKYGIFRGILHYTAMLQFWYLSRYNKNKLIKKASRVTNCSMCGKCCVGCEYLQKDGKCAVWHDRDSMGKSCVYRPTPLQLKIGGNRPKTCTLRIKNRWEE